MRKCRNSKEKRGKLEVIFLVISIAVTLLNGFIIDIFGGSITAGIFLGLGVSGIVFGSIALGADISYEHSSLEWLVESEDD